MQYGNQVIIVSQVLLDASTSQFLSLWLRELKWPGGRKIVRAIIRGNLLWNKYPKYGCIKMTLTVWILKGDTLWCWAATLNFPYHQEFRRCCWVFFFSFFFHLYQNSTKIGCSGWLVMLSHTTINQDKSKCYWLKITVTCGSICCFKLLKYWG